MRDVGRRGTWTEDVQPEGDVWGHGAGSCGKGRVPPRDVRAGVEGRDGRGWDVMGVEGTWRGRDVSRGT